MKDKIKLRKEILDLFYSRFKDFNPIQKLAIPKVLEGKNTLIVAPTGSGKSEASILPVFSKILDIKEKEGIENKLLGLYITPLRALNRDLLDRIKWWGDNLNITTAIRHGDTEEKERSRLSKKPVEFLITTPETFQILFLGKRLREQLKTIRFVIVDEVHELLNEKRGIQLSLGLERLVNYSGEFQRIGLSATIGDLDEAAKFLFGYRNYDIAYWYAEKRYDIKVLYPEITNEDLELARKFNWSPKIAWSLRKMKEIMDKHKSVLIFVNTREMAELIVSRFKMWIPNYPIEIHHSSLSREVRERNEKLFKEGKLKAIVATSSLELGIDIGYVDAVIQYNSPRQVARLVQRVGRAGHRLHEVSIGYIITLDIDDYAESLTIKKFIEEK
ncbi:ATP-dependent DNA helicase Hel308 [Nanoarchaeota archaeon]